MQRIAKFEKVSFEQFEKDWLKCFPDTTNVKEIYDNIKLPFRATSGSAGYDFFAPSDVTFEKGRSVLIPTGIRSKINDGCTTGKVYDVYKAWCGDNTNGYAKSARDFRKNLAEYLGKNVDDLITHTSRGNFYRDYTLSNNTKLQYSRAYGYDDTALLA